MRLAGFLMGLLVACVFLRTLSTPIDYDLWFDLRMGQEIAETGAIPHHATFLASARTFQAPYWVNDEWGFAYLSWQLYHHFGLPGLAVAKSAVIALLALLLCLGCRRAGLASWAMVGLVATELWMVQGRFMLRPQLVTDVFLAFQSLLLLRPPRRLAWGLFALYAVWTNLHGGMVAGLAVLGAVWVGSRLQRRFGLCLLAAALGALVRPDSWQIYAYVYDHFAGRAEMMQNNLEWLPIPLETYLGGPGLFLLLLAIGFGLAAWKRKLVPGELLACLGLTFMAARHNRAVGELGAAGTAFVARAWAPFLPDWRRANLVTAALLVGVICLGPATADWQRTDFPPQVYPVGLLDYLEHHPPRGTLFNSYHLGGFLVFERAPAVVHGMTITYPNQLLRDYLAMLDDPSRQKELVEKYAVGAFLLHYTSPEEAHGRLARRLWDDPDWSLVAFDDVGVLYMPSTEPGYRALNPALPDPFPGGTRAARPELEAKLRQSPESPLAWRLLGQLELREHHWSQALEAYDRSLQLEPRQLDGWLGRAQARLALQDAGGALSDLKQAVSLRPDSGVAHYNLAVLYLKQNNPAQARSEAEKAAQLEFAPARKLLEQL